MKQLTIRDFDPQHFPIPDEQGEATIIFKEYLYDPRQNKALVHVLVVEKNLTQHFWMTIIRKSKGWLIMPLEGCFYIPTPGIQRALELTQECSLGKSKNISKHIPEKN